MCTHIVDMLAILSFVCDILLITVVSHSLLGTVRVRAAV